MKLVVGLVVVTSKAIANGCAPMGTSPGQTALSFAANAEVPSGVVTVKRTVSLRSCSCAYSGGPKAAMRSSRASVLARRRGGRKVKDELMIATGAG